MENKPFTLPRDQMDRLLEQGQWREAFLMEFENDRFGETIMGK